MPCGASILRILGYQTRVIEFVAPEHTARNLMIRARRTAVAHSRSNVESYLALRAQWGAPPYLEELLADELRIMSVPS